MGKYGKWIGGTLGWAFGGPVGAVLGFAFGSMIDGAQTVEGSGDVISTTQRGDFTASLMVLAAAVMKADGNAVFHTRTSVICPIKLLVLELTVLPPINQGSVYDTPGAPWVNVFVALPSM